MTTEYIYLLTGPSGAGKTTVANILHDEYKWRVLDSYTTRRPRFEGETGHTFCTKEEFDLLTDKVASVKYDDNWYCATYEQVQNSDIYVIDEKGIRLFFANYKGKKQPIIISLLVSPEISLERMKKRGDDSETIQKRTSYDKEKYDHSYDMKFCAATKFINTDRLSASTAARLINDDRERRYEHAKLYCSD